MAPYLLTICHRHNKLCDRSLAGVWVRWVVDDSFDLAAVEVAGAGLRERVRDVRHQIPWLATVGATTSHGAEKVWRAGPRTGG